MSWHRHLSTSKKSHMAKTGFVIGTVGFVFLYLQLSDMCRDNWCDVNNGYVIIFFAILMIVGYLTMLKGIKRKIKATGG